MKSRLGNSVEDGGIHRQSNVVLRFGQILPQKQIAWQKPGKDIISLFEIVRAIC